MFPRGLWQGERCFILGGGPSLTAEIAGQVRGHGKTIVLNTTARMAPWADALYFHDWPWFRGNRPIADTFAGLVITGSARAYRMKTRYRKVWAQPPLIQAKPLSSGHHAVDVAIGLGCKAIILLGFDCRLVDGRSNNHDEYKNKGKVYSESFLPAWAEYPERARRAGVSIINCTPGSAIDAFPKVTLDEVLAQ